MWYLPKVKVSKPQQLRGLQPGQWIEYEGTTGRYMGRGTATVWIAWGGTARKRFKLFAEAFRKERDRAARAAKPVEYWHDNLGNPHQIWT